MNTMADESKIRYDMMYDEEFKSQIIRFLKARVPLVNINATDERKAKCFFEHFSRVQGFNFYTWDCVRGLKDINDHSCCVEDEENRDIYAVLKYILEVRGDTQNIDRLKKEGKRGNVFVFSDIEYYLNDPIVVRYLKMIYESPAVSTLFFVTPEINIPKDSTLKNKIRIITPPVNSPAEYENVFEGMLEALGDKNHQDVKQKLIEDKSSLLAKIQGLDLEDAQVVLAVQVITYSDLLKNKK